MTATRKPKPLKTSNPLRRILLILLVFIMLPVFFYTSLELFSLNEDEQMIYGIFEQQLDVVLFSINQYVWDFINNWKRQIEANENYPKSLNSRPETERILQENNALQYVMFTDTMLAVKNIYARDFSTDKNVNEDIEFVKSGQNIINRLKRYKQAGYKKIESVLIRGNEASGDERMILVSFTESNQVLLMMVDFRPFIEQVIVPKLQEIASDGLAIGVFTVDTQESIYQNEDFNFSDSQISKKLWLFPDYLVAIRTKGKSLEELAEARFYNALIYNSILLITLIIGAVIIFRNIRKEVRLAQMKSDFVSNVSHELRTPLALIRMYAETLEMGRVKNEEKRQEYYNIINKEGARLTRLINNILNFSRIESGRKEYSFKELDLNTIIRDTAAIYSYHVQSKGFDFNIKLAEDLPAIYADQEAITECIINLLDNAVKYSDKQKYIKISSGRDADRVYFEIADHGIGVDQKDLDRIFDKFYRVSTGSIHTTKGSGLGLSLVQHIIDAHAGEIEVQSRPGEGTSFRLLFPIHKQEHSN